MDKDQFRELKELEQVTEKVDKNVDAAVVEGFSDKKVLEKLGFSGKIFLSAERTLEDLVEDISRGSDKVAVLTDFDSHGKEQNHEIARRLQQEVDVLRSARDEFGKQLTSTGRRDIEDARPLFEDKEEKFVDAAMDQLFFSESEDDVDHMLENDPRQIGELMPESYRNSLDTSNNFDYLIQEESIDAYDTGLGVELDQGLAENYMGLKTPDSMLSELVKLERTTS